MLVANGGFNLDRANAVLAEGKADAIAFGTAFIANPDLRSMDNYLQAMSVAVRLMLARKLSSVLSYRVAMPRNSLILAK